MLRRFIIGVAAIAALGVSFSARDAFATDSSTGYRSSGWHGCRYGFGLAPYRGVNGVRGDCGYDPYSIYLVGYAHRYFPGPDRSLIVDEGRCIRGLHRMCNVYGVCWAACN